VNRGQEKKERKRRKKKAITSESRPHKIMRTKKETKQGGRNIYCESKGKQRWNCADGGEEGHLRLSVGGRDKKDP